MFVYTLRSPTLKASLGQYRAQICVIRGSKRCRTNRSRAPLLQDVTVIAETSTVLKVLRFVRMFWNGFRNFCFYFFLVLVMTSGSDLNQTDRFGRIELLNLSDQVEEIPEPSYSGFVKPCNTVGKDHFLRRWAILGFISGVNKFPQNDWTIRAIVIIRVLRV